MGELFKQGGRIFWVAPSGGRDRPDEETNEFVVAPFDFKNLDMFRLMAKQSNKVTQGHSNTSSIFIMFHCISN